MAVCRVSASLLLPFFSHYPWCTTGVSFIASFVLPTDSLLLSVSRSSSIHGFSLSDGSSVSVSTYAHDVDLLLRD